MTRFSLKCESAPLGLPRSVLRRLDVLDRRESLSFDRCASFWLKVSSSAESGLMQTYCVFTLNALDASTLICPSESSTTGSNVVQLFRLLDTRR